MLHVWHNQLTIHWPNNTLPSSEPTLRESSVEGAHVASKEGSRGGAVPSSGSSVHFSVSLSKRHSICWYLRILLCSHLQDTYKNVVAMPCAVMQLGELSRKLPHALHHHGGLASCTGNLDSPGVRARAVTRSSDTLENTVALGLDKTSWNLLLARSILHRLLSSSRWAPIL